MKVSVVSFSYPRGVPDDPDDDCWGGFVFDCRLLPDPHGDSGHHRSVYIAERFAARLAGTPGIDVDVKHAAKEFWND